MSDEPVHPRPPSALPWAMRYAAQGWRVLPIRPGAKHPPMQAWQIAATADPTILRNWFEGLYADCGCGLAMGKLPSAEWYLFALDVDEHDPAASGRETLAELERQHGPLPTGPRSLTGGGGLHLLFAANRLVRNTVLGPGLDVRGEGGQIVVAPSIHPDTGRAYEWEAEHAPWEVQLHWAPQWLQAACAMPDRPPASRMARPSPAAPGVDVTPADWLRARWHWPSELERVGWELESGRGDEQHWTRPGKSARQGSSAVLHLPDGPLVVWSTDASMATLRRLGHLNTDDSVSISPLDFEAAYRHGGNIQAASRALRAQMPAATFAVVPSVAPGSPSVATESPEGHSNTPEAAESHGEATESPGAPTELQLLAAQLVNWESAWSGEVETGEDWLAWPLLPRNRQVVLFAPAKVGKSWLALAVAVGLATGTDVFGRPPAVGPTGVLYLDYEMTLADLIERLELLGYGPETDLSRFHYLLAPAIPPLNTEYGAGLLRQLAGMLDVQAVIIDTLGRAVAGEENSADPYRDYARLTGRLLRADGLAVLRTDHAGKNRERGQRGSSAKNDDVDAVYRLGQVDDGWLLERTHTRAEWIPDRVHLRRIELEGGDRLDIRTSPESEPVYPDGTGQLVEQMTALGLTGGNSKRHAAAMLREAGQGARSVRIQAALRWMREIEAKSGPTRLVASVPGAASRERTPEPVPSGTISDPPDPYVTASGGTPPPHASCGGDPTPNTDPQDRLDSDPF